MSHFTDLKERLERIGYKLTQRSESKCEARAYPSGYVISRKDQSVEKGKFFRNLDAATREVEDLEWKSEIGQLPTP